MVHTCSVKGCKSTWYAGCNVKFHTLPVNKARRKLWLSSVPMKSDKYVQARICSLHFSRLDYDTLGERLNKSAIPYFPGYASSSNTSIAMSEARIQIQSTVGDGSLLECRACLQILNGDTVLYNLFDAWMPPWDGMGNSIAEDLAKITNVQISETDRHSKIICETCCNLLLNASNFILYIKKNDEILRQRYPSEESEFNSSNERVWPKPIQVDKPLSINMYENPVDVEIKQEVLSDDDYLANGSYEVQKEDIPDLNLIKIEPEELIQQQPLPIQITVNGSLSSLHASKLESSHLTNGTIDNGEEHLIPKVKDEPMSEDDTDPVLSDLSLECILCAKMFNCVTGLKAHVIAQHSYKSVKRKRNDTLSPEKKKCKYICAICRRTFTTSTDLMVHETCHNKSVCYGCNESFDTFEQLTAHRRTCKAIASKEMTKLKTLDDVLRAQTKEQSNDLACTSCNETFTDVYYMTIHREIHHSKGEDFNMNAENINIDALEDVGWQ